MAVVESLCKDIKSKYVNTEMPDCRGWKITQTITPLNETYYKGVPVDNNLVFYLSLVVIFLLLATSFIGHATNNTALTNIPFYALFYALVLITVGTFPCMLGLYLIDTIFYLGFLHDMSHIPTAYYTSIQELYAEIDDRMIN